MEPIKYYLMMKNEKMYDITGSAQQVEQEGAQQQNTEEIFNQFFGKGGPFSNFSQFSQFKEGFSGFTGFNEEDEYGDTNGRAEKRKGMNSQKSISISLEEAVLGGIKEVTVNAAVKCLVCKGKGTEINSGSSKKCSTCNGKGVSTSKRGFFTVQQVCQRCSGTGKQIINCKTCNGEGHTRTLKKYEVKIPAGIEQNHTLRMKGLGEPGIGGGETGDLIIDINILPNSKFTRNGDNIESKVEISLFQAVLGGKIKVICIDGSFESVIIPPGTQSGDFGMIYGKGVGKKGAHKVFFKILIPKQMNDVQKQLFNQFALSMGEKNLILF